MSKTDREMSFGAVGVEIDKKNRIMEVVIGFTDHNIKSVDRKEKRI